MGGVSHCWRVFNSVFASQPLLPFKAGWMGEWRMRRRRGGKISENIVPRASSLPLHGTKRDKIYPKVGSAGCMLANTILSLTVSSTLSKVSGHVGRAIATTGIDRRWGDANQTPQMVASVIVSSRVVRDLLRQVASVSVADSDGNTIRFMASGDLEARPDGLMAVGVYGTPLHVAATKGFYQGIEWWR